MTLTCTTFDSPLPEWKSPAVTAEQMRELLDALGGAAPQ